MGSYIYLKIFWEHIILLFYRNTWLFSSAQIEIGENIILKTLLIYFVLTWWRFTVHQHFDTLFITNLLGNRATNGTWSKIDLELFKWNDPYLWLTFIPDSLKLVKIYKIIIFVFFIKPSPRCFLLILIFLDIFLYRLYWYEKIIIFLSYIAFDFLIFIIKYFKGRA